MLYLAIVYAIGAVAFGLVLWLDQPRLKWWQALVSAPFWLPVLYVCMLGEGARAILDAWRRR